MTRVLYFTTSTVIDWVDIFTRPSYRHIIVDSLSYCQSHKGLIIYAWVLMSNHLHMVVGTNDNTTVGDVLRDFKKFTNKKLLKALEQGRIANAAEPQTHLAFSLGEFAIRPQ